jgi:hypothetical protein
MTLVWPDESASLLASPWRSDKSKHVILRAFVSLLLLTVTFADSAPNSAGLHENGGIVIIGTEENLETIQINRCPEQDLNTSLPE